MNEAECSMWICETVLIWIVDSLVLCRRTMELNNVIVSCRVSSAQKRKRWWQMFGIEILEAWYLEKMELIWYNIVNLSSESARCFPVGKVIFYNIVKHCLHVWRVIVSCRECLLPHKMWSALGVATPAILTDCLHNQSEEIDQFSADPPCDCKTPPSSSHRYSSTLFKSPAPSPDTSRYYLTEINTNLFSSRGSTQCRVL